MTRPYVLTPYVLTKGAAADLRAIVRYTVQMRGEEQSLVYVARIEAAASAVASGQGVFKKWDELLPGLRVRHEGRHFLFCMPRQNRQALILAILHERMDILARLTERLGP